MELRGWLPVTLFQRLRSAFLALKKALVFPWNGVWPMEIHKSQLRSSMGESLSTGSLIASKIQKMLVISDISQTKVNALESLTLKKIQIRTSYIWQIAYSEIVSKVKLKLFTLESQKVVVRLNRRLMKELKELFNGSKSEKYYLIFKQSCLLKLSLALL